jgi:SAM-dependent methyltransferase
MHDTAFFTSDFFASTYGGDGKVVVDLGGMDPNETLRTLFTKKNMKYISVDLESHKTVDIVIKPGEKLPFDDQSVDLVVSSSCFEHDPMFWMTFKEMCRIIKPEGFIYVSAPSNGKYHCYPGDNWRFYPDAGQALAYWSGVQLYNEPTFPVKVVETFHVLPLKEAWIDFVCVWQRVNEKETSIIISQELINNIGPLEQQLNNNNIKTAKRTSHQSNK